MLNQAVYMKQYLVQTYAHHMIIAFKRDSISFRNLKNVFHASSKTKKFQTIMSQEKISRRAQYHNNLLIKPEICTFSVISKEKPPDPHGS